MKRHTEFQYCIVRIEKSSSIWIFIEDNESGWNKEVFDWTSDEQYDKVLAFIKKYVLQNPNFSCQGGAL